MRVFAFHDDSGCGWYRIKLPLGQLAEHGHDVTLSQGWLQPTDAQIVIGQRLDKPEALPLWRRLRAQAKLVYEIDDDVFSTETVNWMAHQVYSRPVPRDTVAHAAEVADLVTVTTEPLAQVMRQHSDNVAVLPNRIPSRLLGMDRPRRDRVTVGWAGGSSHAADISMVAGPVRRMLDRNKHVDMHLVGMDYSPTIRRACRFTPWTDDVDGYYSNLDFDLGLAPLVDTVFARSKSAIKVMEYQALGIPVLASDVEPYRDHVIDGVTGWLIGREHEWGKRMYELVNDAGMRAEMGRNARELAAGWTVEEHWIDWERAYQGLLGGV